MPAAAAVVGVGLVNSYMSNKANKKAAKTQAHAARDAANAQVQAAQIATDAQREFYNQSRADYAPYRAYGNQALQLLGQTYGISPDAMKYQSLMEQITANDKAMQDVGPTKTARTADDMQAYNKLKLHGYTLHNKLNALQSPTGHNDYSQLYSQFEQSPDYQFASQQGNKAAQARLAAMGLSNSGRAAKELSQYNSGLASQYLQQYRNGLAGLAGVGQTASQSLGGLGANTAGNIGNAAMNAGEGRASSYLAGGRAQADSYINKANNYSSLMGQTAMAMPSAMNWLENKAADSWSLTG